MLRGSEKTLSEILPKFPALEINNFNVVVDINKVCICRYIVIVIITMYK